jgi:hypothetical protein
MHGLNARNQSEATSEVTPVTEPVGRLIQGVRQGAVVGPGDPRRLRLRLGRQIRYDGDAGAREDDSGGVRPFIVTFTVSMVRIVRLARCDTAGL